MSEKSFLGQVEFSEDCGLPKYRQLVEALTVYIQQGVLVPGDILPSIRECAELIGVSQITVTRAYQILVKKKLIAVKGKAGHFVLNGLKN